MRQGAGERPAGHGGGILDVTIQNVVTPLPGGASAVPWRATPPLVLSPGAVPGSR
jgi:hypothetical protein